jgi:prevent-host-death family protein
MPSVAKHFGYTMYMPGKKLQVSLGDARDQLSKLVQAVLDGQQVTILRHGEPVVDLVRTQASKREAPKFGTMKGRILIKDPNWHKGPQTNEELGAWLEGKFD